MIQTESFPSSGSFSISGLSLILGLSRLLSAQLVPGFWFLLNLEWKGVSYLDKKYVSEFFHI